MKKWFKFPCGCTLYMDDKSGEVYKHAFKDNKHCFKDKCSILIMYELEAAVEKLRGYAFNDGFSMQKIREQLLLHGVEDTIENLKEIMNGN